MPSFLLRAAALLCCVTMPVVAQQAAGVNTSPVPDKTSPFPDGETSALRDVKNLHAELSHVQGVDLDDRHIWVTWVRAADRKGFLTQFDRASGEFQRQLDVTDGPRFHPGGFSRHNGSLWIPVAEYRPNSSAVIVEVDAETFAIKKKYPVADHLGCVAVNDDRIVAGNWGSQKLYILDREGHTLRVVDTPSTTQYQDIKFDGGYLVASGTAGPKSGSVTWFTWPGLEPTRTLQFGLTDRGRPYTAEGMAVQGSDLYLLPEDGPTRMFHFVVDRHLP